jgi:hypothetical protein
MGGEPFEQVGQILGLKVLARQKENILIRQCL